jgi:hypothetical protein
MQMFSLANLKYRATIQKPKNYNLETLTDYYDANADVPCNLVAETEGRGSGGLGRTLTGRYNIYFQSGIDLSPNDILVITKLTKSIGTFKVDTCVSLDTHVEGVVDKTR